MDKKVEEVIKQVEDTGISRHTLIIFAVDTGTSTEITSKFKGSTIKGGKGFPKTIGTHVPFIAHWAGTIKLGQVNPNLVDFTDMLPTFMQVATAKVPTNFKTDGISMYDQAKCI